MTHSLRPLGIRCIWLTFWCYFYLGAYTFERDWVIFYSFFPLLLLPEVYMQMAESHSSKRISTWEQSETREREKKRGRTNSIQILWVFQVQTMASKLKCAMIFLFPQFAFSSTILRHSIHNWPARVGFLHIFVYYSHYAASFTQNMHASIGHRSFALSALPLITNCRKFSQRVLCR